MNEFFEIVVFDENGQGVINFDSLLFLTDEKFVDEVKFAEEHGYSCLELTMDSDFLTLILSDDTFFRTFIYCLKDGWFTVRKFTMYDIEDVLRLKGLKIVKID